MLISKELGAYRVTEVTPWGLGTFVLFLCIGLVLGLRYRRGLRDIPGPFLASISPVDRLWIAASGRGYKTHMDYHQKYGSLVRVGPNHVSVSDPQYIPMIYGIAGKFHKVQRR